LGRHSRFTNNGRIPSDKATAGSGALYVMAR
jgi:hypothetical protein